MNTKLLTFEMSVKEKSSKLLKKNFLFLELAGMNVSKPDYRPNFLTFSSICAMLAGNITGVYSLYIEFPNFISMLKTLPVFATMIQMTVKACFTWIKMKRFRATFQKLDIKYKEIIDEDSERIAIAGLRTTEKMATISSVVHSCSFLMIVFAPVYNYNYFYANDNSLVMPMYYPFIDHTSHNGFVATLALQFFQLNYMMIGMALPSFIYVSNLGQFVIFSGKEF